MLTRFLLMFCLGTLSAQTNFTELDYRLTVTYIPEIVNYRNTTLTIGERFVHYSIDYSPKSTGSIDDSSELILVESIDKKEYFSEILIDRQDSILIENTFDRLGTKKFLSVEEELPAMNWKITTEKKEISGYQCNIATLNFRGRSYTAYFTFDVPINIGPWKFNGLPGLIVAIYDEAGIYKWELNRIRNVPSMEKKLNQFNSMRRKFQNVTYETFDRNIIEAKLSRLRVAKSRSGSRKYAVSHSFSTEQWLEPTNEYRSKVHFTF